MNAYPAHSCIPSKSKGFRRLLSAVSAMTLASLASTFTADRVAAQGLLGGGGLQAPTFTELPVGQILQPGGQMLLVAGAIGFPPPEITWALNGNPIPGAVGPLFLVNGVNFADSGNYTAIAENEAGANESPAAFVKVVAPSLPATDAFAGRGTIDSAVGVAWTDNREATAEAAEPSHAGHPAESSVWVRWVAPISGIASLSTAGSGIDTRIAVYTVAGGGGAIGSLTRVVENDDFDGYNTSGAYFSVTQGTAYEIALDSFHDAEGDIMLHWQVEPSALELPSIERQPQHLTVAPGAPAAFSVELAGNIALPGFQWYRNGNAIPGANGALLNFQNVGASDLGAYSVEITNGPLSIFSDAAQLQINSEGLDMLAADKLHDAIGAGFSSGLSAGKSSKAKAKSSSVGSVAAKRIGSKQAPTVAKSLRVPRGKVQYMRGYSGSQSFNTSGSSRSSGEPVHCGRMGGASYWISYQPPSSGTLYLTTGGSSFDTILGVYQPSGYGYGWESVSSVTCNDNTWGAVTSRVRFNVYANTTYYIAVDGVGGSTGNAYVNYDLY